VGTRAVPIGRMELSSGRSHTSLVEDWLSSAEYDAAQAAAYAEARGGTGSNDRNISPGCFEAVIDTLHAGLVGAGGSATQNPLSSLPAPDSDFIRTAVRMPPCICADLVGWQARGGMQ
jgi:hypothetical protein